MQIIAKPVTVLRNELIESLLISYAYAPAEATFAIVCDYGNMASGSDRAFLRLVFGGVRDYRRELGMRKELQGFTTDYSTKLTVGSTVVQSVMLKEEAGSMLVELWFGPGFGQVSFTSESVVGQVRNARARVREGGWDYFDFETGAPIDFYAPFD